MRRFLSVSLWHLSSAGVDFTYSKLLCALSLSVSYDQLGISTSAGFQYLPGWAQMIHAASPSVIEGVPLVDRRARGRLDAEADVRNVRGENTVAVVTVSLAVSSVASSGCPGNTACQAQEFMAASRASRQQTPFRFCVFGG